MQAIKPTPSQAAFVLKKFLKENGVSMKLSKTQEAVARMQGFSNWNALTSAMDPKIGVSVRTGCLQREGDTDYRLTTGKQSSVWVGIENIDVYIKHDDEGVVVDLYPKGGRENVFESLASTYLTFDEAGEDAEDGEERPASARHNNTHGDPEEDSLDESIAKWGVATRKHETSFDLLLLLLTADHARDVAYGDGSIVTYKNAALIRKALESKHEDKDLEVTVFEFMANNGMIRAYSLAELLEAVPRGASGWSLPEGRVLVAWNSKAELSVKAELYSEDMNLSWDQRGLLTRVLEATAVELPDTAAVAPIQWKDVGLLQRVLNGGSYEPAAEAIRFNTSSFPRGITIQALLDARRVAENRWVLPSGDELAVFQSTNS